MTKTKTILALPFFSASLLFAGCASLPTTPIIDAPPSAQLDADMYDCQAYANSYVANQAPVNNAIIASALTGAAIGGIEDAWDGAIIGAALGGLFGLVQGKAEHANATSYERDHIVRRCLSGRGHRVIG